MTKLGMDPKQVRHLAGRIGNKAGDLTTVISEVDQLVKQTQQHWWGTDAQDFAALWTSKYRPSLASASKSLESLATTARKNADEQVTTSSVSGIGNPTTTPPTIPPTFPRVPTFPPNGDPTFPTTTNNPANFWGTLWKGTSYSTDGQWHGGPWTEGSLAGSMYGIPISGSGDAFAGPNAEGHFDASAGLKDGLNVNADGTVRSGVGADGTFAVGNKYYSVDGEGHVLFGAQADGKAGAHLGLDGANLYAAGGVAAGLIASGKITQGNQYLKSTTEVKGLVGGEAKADAGLMAGRGGVAGSASASAFLGAKATVEQSYDIGGVEPKAAISAQAGVGASAGVEDFSIGKDDIGADVKLGLALGPGLEVKGGLHVHPQEVMHNVEDIASGGWHLASAGAGALGSLF